MEQKDLIKYGLIALGAYLIYKYIEDNGGLSAVLSGTPLAPALPAAIPGTLGVNPPPPVIAGATTHPSTTTPIPPPVVTPAVAATSQQVLAAATAAGEPNSLNFDQWNFYYSQVTGNASPVDPGAIPASVYSGAGAVDRTSLIPISTWLAIMQNQAPSLGLSAFYGPGSVKYYAPWLN
jgi:hypothetical protein